MPLRAYVHWIGTQPGTVDTDIQPQGEVAIIGSDTGTLGSRAFSIQVDIAASASENSIKSSLATEAKNRMVNDFSISFGPGDSVSVMGSNFVP